MNKPIQLDLFGDGIAQAYVDKHMLKNSKKKLYKPCSSVKCCDPDKKTGAPALVPNVPWRHKCPSCRIRDAPIDTVQGLRIILAE